MIDTLGSPVQGRPKYVAHARVCKSVCHCLRNQFLGFSCVARGVTRNSFSFTRYYLAALRKSLCKLHSASHLLVVPGFPLRRVPGVQL